MSTPVPPKQCTARVLSPSRLPVLLGKSPFSDCGAPVIQVGPCEECGEGHPVEWGDVEPCEGQYSWVHAELAGGPCGAVMHGIEGEPTCRQQSEHWHHDGNTERAPNHRHDYVPTEWVERGWDHEAKVD